MQLLSLYLFKVSAESYAFTSYIQASFYAMFGLGCFVAGKMDDKIDMKTKEELLKLFDIPSSILPTVKSSSEVYGTASILKNINKSLNIPITSVIGDQQASLFGQCCFNAGDVKNTYGTGCFMLMNTKDKIVSSKQLLDALAENFEGFEDLQNTLLAYPKMGNNEESVDDKATFLMDIFTQSVNGKPNNRGGVWRAGTGSAMEYISSANKVGATADGKKAKEPYTTWLEALAVRLREKGTGSFWEIWCETISEKLVTNQLKEEDKEELKRKFVLSVLTKI